MSNDAPTYGFDTLQIHAGARPDPATGSRQTPILVASLVTVAKDRQLPAIGYNLLTFFSCHSFSCLCPLPSDFCLSTSVTFLLKPRQLKNPTELLPYALPGQMRVCA